MPTLHESRKPKFTAFIAWVQQHISGDERGEAQIFLDRLFKAFEHDGLSEAAATCEMRVKKALNRLLDEALPTR